MDLETQLLGKVRVGETEKVSIDICTLPCVNQLVGGC